MGEGVGVGGGTLAWRVGRQGQKRWEAGGERDEVSDSIEARDGDAGREASVDVLEMLARL
ncbi:hypothetical protein BGW80DRAFT_1298367 [Lactifluus volemus]|nr:hypothetical protein BGW80DRAFT_1298367 [Lactifluus volemus]